MAAARRLGRALAGGAAAAGLSLSLLRGTNGHAALCADGRPQEFGTARGSLGLAPIATWDDDWDRREGLPTSNVIRHLVLVWSRSRTALPLPLRACACASVGCLCIYLATGAVCGGERERVYARVLALARTPVCAGAVTAMLWKYLCRFVMASTWKAGTMTARRC